MDVETRPLVIDSGGTPLPATLMSPNPSRPGILFIHGWGGSQQRDLERAVRISGMGCVCLTFDLRGHQPGSTDRDRVSREDNFRDVVAAYELLVAQPYVDRRAIAVVGISYGAYLAALLSSERPVRWLALRTPALYRDAHWHAPKISLNGDPGLMDYRRSAVAWEENLALRACAAFQGDALLVQAGRDAVIPPQTIASYREAFVQARSLTLRNAEEADHGFSSAEDQRTYRKLLVAWLAEMIGGEREKAADLSLEPRRYRQAHAEPDDEPRALT